MTIVTLNITFDRVKLFVQQTAQKELIDPMRSILLNDQKKIV